MSSGVLVWVCKKHKRLIIIMEINVPKVAFGILVVVMAQKSGVVRYDKGEIKIKKFQTENAILIKIK